MIDVTQDELQRHIDDFLARLNIQMLVTGNMHKDVRISLSGNRVDHNQT
jgi:insulysin